MGDLKPYYDHAGITIYHGDCRDVLPHLEPVDLLLTDPPYGIGEAGGKNKSRGKLARSKDYGNASWDDKPIDYALMEQCIAKARHACIWGGNYYPLPPSSAWLIWDKQNGQTDFADVEMAWTNYGTAARLIQWLWHGMLRKGREPRWHPTQKPRGVMAWSISKCPMDVTSVLDTFMGVGTTLVAAKERGCRAIGIERVERYCEIAATRLSQDVLPGVA